MADGAETWVEGGTENWVIILRAYLSIFALCFTAAHLFPKEITIMSAMPTENEIIVVRAPQGELCDALFNF